MAHDLLLVQDRGPYEPATTLRNAHEPHEVHPQQRQVGAAANRGCVGAGNDSDVDFFRTMAGIWSSDDLYGMGTGTGGEDTGISI